MTPNTRGFPLFQLALIPALLSIASTLTGCTLMRPAEPANLDTNATSGPAASAAIPDVTQAISWGDITALPKPSPGTRRDYGATPEQYGILRLPKSAPPENTGYPVVVLIHGGCWLSEYDLAYFEHWAEWLSEQGWATWNLEYRRVGNAGGGWPGTFDDIVSGINFLQTLAQEKPLNLGDISLMGHSAGGHLALWVAGSGRLGTKPRRVIGLAAITDLADYSHGPEGSCHSAVKALMGGEPVEFPTRYADASPANWLKAPETQRRAHEFQISLVHGSKDPIVAPSYAESFVEQGRTAGLNAQWLPITGAGHFDLGVPTPASKAAVRIALDSPR